VAPQSTDGTYNFTIGQTDAAGNTSGTTALQWVRDSTVPPNPVFIAPGASPYLANAPALVLSGTCVTGYTVNLSGGVVASDITAPTSILSQVCAAGGFSFTVSKSADAAYSLAVSQTSLAGFTSGSASVTWTRDTTPPVTTITLSPPATNLSGNATFNFSAADTNGTSLQCKLDEGSYSSCVSPLLFTNMANGAHTFSVRAIDGAGNSETTPPTYTWTQASYLTIALYHFNTAGPSVDSSLYTAGNNNSLTSNTGTNVTPATPKFAEAQKFVSASTQFGSVAHTPTQALLTGTLTVDAWINMTALPTGAQAIISKNGAASGKYGWEFGVTRSSSSYYLYVKGCITAAGCTTAPGTKRASVKITGFAIGTWYHVAMTFNKGAVTYYVNGVANGTASLGTNVSLYVPTAQALQVGRTGTGSAYFNGTIDELRVSQNIRWTSAFTPAAAAYSPD
jgi:hypothetical protein